MIADVNAVFGLGVITGAALAAVGALLWVMFRGGYLVAGPQGPPGPPGPQGPMGLPAFVPPPPKRQTRRQTP